MPVVSTKRPSPAACTIITRCYLSHAQILIESYRRHEPAGHFYLIVVDGLPEGVTAGAHVTMIALEDLQIPYLNELLFKYDVVEFCTAIKPTLLAMLMNRFDEKQVLYIDPDIMIARPLDEVAKALETSSIVLTPHLLRPHEIDGQHPSDQDILMAGAYNLGFIGLSKTTQTLDFLKWWEQRLRDGCRIDPATGLMTDQKWIDLVPGLYSSTTILRDDTYNVAYWNTNARRIIRSGQQFLVNARPLAFFHFSNFDPANPLAFSRDHGRGPITKGTGLADLLELYARLQVEKGYITSIEWKYQRATFDNGLPTSAPMRKLYQSLSPSAREPFGNPFHTSGNPSFFNWATTGDQSGLSPFLKHIYESRLDLQGAFPDITGEDHERFLHWAQTTGPTEMGYDGSFAGVQASDAVHEAPIEYSELVARLKQIIRESIPPQAVVAIISKGDRDLLQLDGRTARHFPQTETGQYAGHYPRDGVEALDHLRSQAKLGTEYLIVPATAMWWLDHYAEFNRYLQDDCKTIAHEPGIGRIFALGDLPTIDTETPEQRIDQIRQQRAAQVGELLAENLELRSRVREFEMLQRASQVEDVQVYWRSEANISTTQSGPQKPKLISTGDIRWLSHDTTGRLVSIILPVNAGLEILPRLASQQCEECIEVIGFLVGEFKERQDTLEQFGATIIGIDPVDPLVLNQNAARTFAGKFARGAILVFLGENTLPVDDQWLAGLMTPLDSNPKIAAVCSKLENEKHRQSANEFHIESTAIRADIFRTLPFAESPLADARVWAKAVERAGFSICTQSDSVALHTPHSSGIIDHLRRGISDGMLDDQIPQLPDIHDSTPAELAESLGRWVGRYLNFTSITHQRSGGK